MKKAKKFSKDLKKLLGKELEMAHKEHVLSPTLSLLLGKEKKVTRCHYICLEENDFLDVNALIQVKVFFHDDHEWRKLFRCKKCGQLYVQDVEESVDWDRGNDTISDVWIPVSDEDLDKYDFASDSLYVRSIPDLMERSCKI